MYKASMPPAASSVRQGESWVWLCAGMVSLTLLLAIVLVGVLLFNGLGFLWPADVLELQLKQGTTVLGQLREKTTEKDLQPASWKLKTGNRDLAGSDFQWISLDEITSVKRPQEVVVLERQEFGNFYGRFASLQLHDITAVRTAVEPDWELAQKQAHQRLKQLQPQKKELSRLAKRQESLRLKALRLAWRTPTDHAVVINRLQKRQQELTEEFETLRLDFQTQLEQLRQNQASFTDSHGRTMTIPLVDIVQVTYPNALSPVAKMGWYLQKLVAILTQQPREANTEGGLAPAIFGTVLMVFLMSLFCIPLGVLAAVYLREYAKEGLLLSMVRVAVYNLAGVPSIVFGVFGLGFFVYGIGGGLDKFFFPERLPTPTFGTGGILWASLTLALLTVPVVIVATEEGLSSIPKGLRQASYALGATRLQTLTRVVLPMATPSILTGFVLAIARAAGETAPLMITGVVKLAPNLPLDTQFPYLHLERKFMHLAFHIFDLGFQSPNAEATEPMVYFTSLLLVLIVVLLSLSGIWIRNHMRSRLKGAAF